MYRQIQLAIANCDEDVEGTINYHTESVQMAKLILAAQVRPFTFCLLRLLEADTQPVTVV